MAKKNGNKNGGRGEGREFFINLKKSRDDIPEPQGKFRNLFAERGMMPKGKKTNGSSQSERRAPKSE